MFRPTKIRHYVSFMQSRGFDAEAVLRGTGMTMEQLQQPSCLTDFAQHQAVVANMIKLTDNQGIGLDVGSEAELTDFGIVGHAMMSSKNARDAVSLWLRYSNALVGMLLTMRLEEFDDGSWALTLAELRPMGFLYNFSTEELLMMIVRLSEVLTKHRYAPAEVELSYPAPAHHARYTELLGCEPRFNSRHTRIRFNRPSLDLPVKGSDEEFNAICLQHCSQIMRQIAGDSPLVARIRNLLLTRGKSLPALDELAAELGLSTRSLRRHLQKEGYSFKTLIAEFRVDLAKEYLGNSRMTTKETAYLLGFKDPNAFRRAFKSWTGKTIHEFCEEADAAENG